jgi:antitoxin component YwqK of YwqJK toxin-antitoxin module
MKKLFLITLLITALPACQHRRNNEVVKVTFIHKYGVPVTEKDWYQQGQNGQLVELSNDGVTTTKTYHGGVLHGETTYTFPNSSTIQYKERYNEGILISKCEHYSSGVPHREESFEGSHRTKVTTWYEQGTPRSIECYTEGCLTSGEYKNLYNEIESRVQEGTGIRLQYDHEGTLIAKEKIENGTKVESTLFYANREPKSITPYENGQIHGTRLTFFIGGLPHTVEEWRHGQQEGTTVIYQNGEKVASIPYIRGKKEGVSYAYRDGNIIAEEITWKNDKMHGMRTLHLGEGQTKIEWYIQNELVNKPTFDRLDPLR